MRTTGWVAIALAAAATLLVPRAAHAGEPLKPYVFLVLDTSGSMDASTDTGRPSCGGQDSRLDHARCAINNIANSYGDMVLGLGRFRATMGGAYPGCTLGDPVDCQGCNANTGAGCPTAGGLDTRLEVLSGLNDGNNDLVAAWTNFSINTCDATGSNPEIWAAPSWTPISGTMGGVARYWSGQQASDGTVLWPAGTAGHDPIRNDPFKNVFLPSGEQCRPYVTILLTDGDETCADFDNPTTGALARATGLLTTSIDGQSYRVETKAIGFGMNGPSTQIEQIAHAGGATDGVGNEGYYAQNETSLQLAISNIISDAIRSEVCNDLDDDCDTFIDEDFTSKGAVCSDAGIGECQGHGTFVCRIDGTGTECLIDDVGALPTDEVCNGLDDDCDTKIDEGDVCVGCSGVELCNNTDDDCDGNIDEDLTRPCGTDIGECTAGTETCAAGVWAGCDATGPFVEVCDALDNDCDGSVNGFAEECSVLPGGNPNVGECHPGDRVCAINGVFGACLGEVVPTTEICDTLDNDCDGTVDEDTGGADCSTDCGLGQTVCVMGVLECNAVAADDDDTCNGIDDDCDGSFDEDAPDGGPCEVPGEVCNGTLICMTGTYACVGDPIQDTDVCDCEDNDCDDQIDEGNGACPGGSTCSDCACRFPCQPGEFPCNAGQICDTATNFCIEDVCANVNCQPLPDGTATECDQASGACVSVCAGVTCNDGLICFGPTGECEPDNCSTFPERCGEGEHCEAGACVADPCFGVTCTGETYCLAGDCIGSCADVDCPTGERCRLGLCETDPCGGDCGSGQVCNDSTGTCVADPCDGITCDPGEACDPQSGACSDDPCRDITCPGDGQVCRLGTCFDPAQIDEELVTTGGGGGCSTTGGAGGFALVGLALMLGLRGPRGSRRGRRTKGGAL